MALAAAIEPTVSMALGHGALSASFSAGRRAVSYLWPQLDSSSSFSYYLPSAPSLTKSYVWGTILGAYSKMLDQRGVYPTERKFDRVFTVYAASATLASYTTETLFKEDFLESMKLGVPFGYFLGGVNVASRVSRQILIPPIPVYRA